VRSRGGSVAAPFRAGGPAGAAATGALLASTPP
jgi:hypothetical protein